MGAGLILLDEPTANIDPEGVADVREAVIAATESTGATVVIVERRVMTPPIAATISAPVPDAR